MSSENSYPVIWLQPGCEGCNQEDRLWCQDNAFEQCEECGAMPVKYVLAPDQPEPRPIPGEGSINAAVKSHNERAGADA